MSNTKHPIQGDSYTLTYTQPMYDKDRKSYLPDNFRFVEPNILHVIYGGRAGKGISRYCAVCGRKGDNPHQFLDLDSGKEVFFSEHCLNHESTQLWKSDYPEEKIKKWYSEEELQRSYRSGDPLAGLVVALRDMDPNWDPEEDW